MEIKGKIKTGKYFDSVSLMLAAKEVLKMPGVLDAAAVMATEKNKEIVEASGMLLPEFVKAGETDLLLCVKAASMGEAEAGLEKAEEILAAKKVAKEGGTFRPRSISSAVADNPDANLVLISIAGRYAAGEAMKALEAGLNVMLFSDNVSLEDEVALKRYADRKGLIVMGPDCGTAIVNGIPLAFANVVRKGSIGVVGASGTGLQEVTCTIGNLGAGVSQAIGTGGRDIKAEVGGISFLAGLRMLKADEETKVVVLVAKPPAPEVMKKLSAEVKSLGKPVVAIFFGADASVVKEMGAIPASTLEEAANIAVALDKGENPSDVAEKIERRNAGFASLAIETAQKFKDKQKYLRGLFCGGTFSQEALMLLKPRLGEVFSNISKENALSDSWKSTRHTIVDLGEDEFTVGRPHPMIDFSLRNRRILEEARDPETAVILLDVVLGYGSNMQPIEELAPVLRDAISIAKEGGRHLAIVFSVTGTEGDPQSRSKVIKALENEGALFAPSTASAADLAGKIIEKIA